MFGLENRNKGKDEFVFELEKEMKDPVKGKALVKKIENRINIIKTELRSGESKEDFEKLGLLLYGYAAILKVIKRANTKSRTR